MMICTMHALRMHALDAETIMYLFLVCWHARKLVLQRAGWLRCCNSRDQHHARNNSSSNSLFVNLAWQGIRWCAFPCRPFFDDLTADAKSAFKQPRVCLKAESAFVCKKHLKIDSALKDS